MRKTLFCAVAVLAAVPALAGLRGGPVPAIDTAGIAGGTAVILACVLYLTFCAFAVKADK